MSREGFMSGAPPSAREDIRGAYKPPEGMR